MKRFLLTLCAVCATTLAWAAYTWTDPETGIEWTYTVSDSKASVGGGTSALPAVSVEIEGVLVIPDQINGYNVTAIGTYAFFDCSALTSITIPSSVTLIGNNAFENCSALTSITLPTGMTAIRDNVFSHCSSLTSVTIPEGVTSIGSRAFIACSNLPTITLPASLNRIGDYAFDACSKLKVEVASGNAYYVTEEGALFNKSKTTLIRAPGGLESYTIPASVTVIGGTAFSGCPITSIVVPNTVSSIGHWAFGGCTQLTSVELPLGISISFYAFENVAPTTLKANYVPDGMPRANLKTVVIPENTKTIPDSAFSDCSGLTSVTIPEGVTSIGSHAFYQCRGLTSITIPSSVVSIGERAFSWCERIETIEVSVGVTSLARSVFDGCTLLKTIILPETITVIEDLAFWGCESLVSITIPPSVTSIGSEAFSGCSGLKEVHISDVATWCAIGFGNDSSNPLYYAKNLYLNGELVTDLVIPEGVTSIGDSAFRDCSGLTSVTIPEGVTSIGNSAFRYCSGLTSVTIPEGVTSIGDYAFYDCSGLTSVTIPEGVTSIGNYAFSGCSGLTSFSLPASVIEMSANALPPSSANLKVLEVAEGNPLYYTNPEKTLLYTKDKSTLLRVAKGGISGEVSLENGLTTIPNSAFSGCSSLTSITIPEGVTSIGNNAFDSCTGLTFISFPETALTIGTGVLQDCTALQSVKLPDVLTTISGWFFYNCSSLTSITIPEGVTSIGHDAFYNCSSLKTVQMDGPVPSGFTNSELRNCQVAYSKEYGADYKAILGTSHSYIGVISTAGVTVSAEMTTPRTMKVTYSVKSDLSTVKVRAVAFADGVRSFAKIVPVKSGENVPLGGEKASNTEHTFTWDVVSDWDEDLSKVAIEILVQEGELLPQELITIPAVGENKAMTIARNTITTEMAFNALLWCIAEGDEALTIENGVVKTNGKQIASGTRVTTDEYAYYNRSVSTLLNYLYGKMGYKVLAGDDLTYAKAATRIDFPNSGIEQRAIKIEE